MSQYIVIWLCYVGLIVMIVPMFKSFQKTQGKSIRTKLVITILSISISLFVLFGVGLSLYNCIKSSWFDPIGVLFVMGILSMAGCVISIYLIYKE